MCLSQLDSITHYLYLLKVIDGNPDKNNPTKEESKLKKKMDDFTRSSGSYSSLLEQRQAFNSISTPGKKEFLKRAKVLSKHEGGSYRDFRDSAMRMLHVKDYGHFGGSLRGYVIEAAATLNTIDHANYGSKRTKEQKRA